MKMCKYEYIQPNNRTNFVMVYYHAGRTLTQIETLLKKPTATHYRSDRATVPTACNSNLNKWSPATNNARKI